MEPRLKHQKDTAPFDVKWFLITGIPLGILLLVLVILLDSRTLFPTTMKAFDLNDRSIMMPNIPSSVPSSVNMSVSLIITLCALMLNFILGDFDRKSFKLIKKSLRNRNKWVIIMCKILFTFYGLLIMKVLTRTSKHWGGGMRPNFIAVCEPDPNITKSLGGTYVNETLSKTICTNEASMESRWSFPSGHASQAAYTMMLTILALQNTRFPSEFVAVQALLQLGAATYCTFVCFSRIADYHHHWWDVLAGAILGGAVAAFVWYGYIKKRTFSAPKEAPKEGQATDPTKV